MINTNYQAVEAAALALEKLTVGNISYIGNVETSADGNIVITNAMQVTDSDMKDQMGNVINNWSAKFIDGSLSNFNQVLGNTSLMQSELHDLEKCKIEMALCAVKYNMKHAYTNILGMAINGMF